MKIGFFEVEEWEKDILRKAFPKDKLVFSKEKLSVGVDKDFDAVSVFIYSEINERILAKIPKLKLIVTRSTGFNHIDLEACKRNKVVVCNVPTYGANTVAEHTFALILGLSRKLIESIERTRKGNFDLKGLRGFDLQGKVLGVVGCGSIGKHVVRIAHGFEMKILVFDVCKDKKFSREMGFDYVALDKLLRESDIVSLHMPLNKHTHHLINDEKIKLMKKGALLINTSRGEVVDTDALVKGLKTGKLAGAGLDVLENECNLKEERALLTKEFSKTCDLKTVLEEEKLMKMPNVLITPHNAFNTNEALMRILEVTIENIKSFKKGKKVNTV